MDQAIKRQIQPCADRQPALGPGAERIRVVLNLRLDRSGRLTRPPSVVRTSGVDEDNARYEDQVTDQAIRVYRACSPLRLPPELCRTPEGGWAGTIRIGPPMPQFVAWARLGEAAMAAELNRAMAEIADALVSHRIEEAA